MAELVAGAFLSSFFQVTLERLASTDLRDYFRRGKLDSLVEDLENKLSSFNQVLDDAEIKQYQSTDVKKWLGDLKHAMYEADQLLDEVATDAPLKKLKAESQPVPSMVRGFFSAFTNNPFESRIKELLQNLDSLAKRMDTLGLKEVTCASHEGGVSGRSSNRLPTTSLVDESSTYGRDGDKEEIIKFLLSDNDNGNQVPVISIVGLGGMGKTTLAQLVYNDPRMQEQFELRAWVFVSESFDVVGLTKAVLREYQSSADGESFNDLQRQFQSSADGESFNDLQRQLQQRLTGKRYLLVLDDVWYGNGESWERLLLPFNHGSSGSKIIVTTRDKEVASVMKSTQILHLKPLEESQCWCLFVRHAFHGKNVSDHPNLESIGKNIVDKCGGLPIAVKALGNLLQRKFSQREWVKILDTDMKCLSENESNINPTLRLSYHNLPSNLKRCFAYCSVLPKGYKFDKDQLIKLWMAEGLLKCRGTNKSEEELGNEFFDDLQSISFFQQSRWRQSFVMHDLVHDLAKSVSGEFCLQIEGDRVQSIPERTRHIQCSPESKDGDKILEHICECKGLRSLMVKGLKLRNKVQHDLFSRLKYLRMLSFCGCDLSELADEISNLKLLRYLDLSWTGIKSLPDSICTLYNLQTLILKYCKLTKLPSDFHKLVNLRHLHLNDTRIEKIAKHIGRLVHLQTLAIDFVVGEQSGSDIKELANLSHLQGTLSIKGLENVTDPAHAAEANLKDKKHLEELCMVYGGSREIYDASITERDVSVFEALQPNSNLNRLTIKFYPGASFPNWLGDCRHLPNLVSLNLWACEFCTQLPPLGQLPSLKKLVIGWCHGIKVIGEEFYGNNSSNVLFRSLEFLQFYDMSKWEGWLCPKDFPSLKELSVSDCPELKSSLPERLPYLQKLKIHNCKGLGASIPKAANIIELRLLECDNILVNELPSSLKIVSIGGTRVIEAYLEQILFNNAFLEELDVDCFKGANLEWSSLDLRCCNSLRTLSIREWSSSSLPFALHLFTNLHSLMLSGCPRLESFPKGGLPSSLGSLNIYGCPKLVASREEWGLFKLHSLNRFEVSDDFENVESFPEESLLPPTLESLRLSYCSKLRIINYRGLLHLESLKSLSIWGCPCLECLPEEGLPNSLSTLFISCCPLLKQLYQKEEGERRHKIRHIPSMMFD